MKTTQTQEAIIFGNNFAEASEIYEGGIQSCLAYIKAINSALEQVHQTTKMVNDPEITPLFRLVDVFCDAAKQLEENRNKVDKAA